MAARPLAQILQHDVYQALQFAAVTGIVLPLVPDHPYGPYGAFNPITIWLMVVLVSGLGFVGYVAVRIFGEDRGIPSPDSSAASPPAPPPRWP